MKTALKTLLAVGVLASFASADLKFDYSRANQGSGFMTVDGSWYQGENTSKVEAFSKTYNGWYLMGHGLEMSECPANIADPTLTESACYWGWNNDDGITDSGFTVRVSLPEFANPSGWGYANGGLIYILDGTQLGTANYVNIGSSLTVKFWAEAGKPVRIYVIDKNYYEPEPGAEVGVMKVALTGTGNWQEVTKQTSAFAPYVGATNTLDASQVKAIELQYELAAGASAQPIAQATGYPIANAILVWQKLETDGSGSAIGDKVASQSVGFAALRNGLQFSNVGSATLNVQVFNTLGKVVASHKVTAKNSFVSTEGLGNGVYVVRATDGAKLNMMRNVTIMR